MRRAGLVLGLLVAACAKQVALGETCAETKECGKGADCYRGICTPLCADDGECDGELVCARHHCLLATGEPRRKVDDRSPIADDRLPKADGRSPNADDRLPKADDRLPNADSRLPSADDRPRRPGLRSTASSEPPLDPTVLTAELKAIRAELESLRKEQQRINEAITDLRARQ